MVSVPTALYLAANIKRCEQMAMASPQVTSSLLMKRAGSAAFNVLRRFFPEIECLTVFCGGGNNGGDGYVLALLAHQQGLEVILHQTCLPTMLPEPAREMALAAQAAGIKCVDLHEAIDSRTQLIIDALIGTGLTKKVSAAMAKAIHFINHSALPVLSLDIPSGLNADNGICQDVAVKATLTVTFIAPKVGLYTADGPDHCGKIICKHLNIKTHLKKLKPDVQLLAQKQFMNALPNRLKNTHKGVFGHVLVIGGGIGMPGAAYLTALAALRVGAGMVTVATHPSYASGMLQALPEALVYGVANKKELQPLLAKATVVIIGPGLGEDEWAYELFKETLATPKPLVIDASALTLLARAPQKRSAWILTPHPGEAARLLDCSVSEVQADRLRATQLLQQCYGGQIVLKGVGTLIGDSEKKYWLCGAGNPGMASAGMGDLLSGIIGGLLAQQLPATMAAPLAVWLHATAGDNAALASGERGLLAHDLMPYVRQQLHSFKRVI